VNGPDPRNKAAVQWQAVPSYFHHSHCLPLAMRRRCRLCRQLMRTIYGSQANRRLKSSSSSRKRKSSKLSRRLTRLSACAHLTRLVSVDLATRGHTRSEETRGDWRPFGNRRRCFALRVRQAREAASVINDTAFY
jgi:hypothetical protein